MKADRPAAVGDPKPAVPPAAAVVAAPAGTLAAARLLKATDPGAAYAALKAIVKASPNSADAVAAARDLRAMEADPIARKKVMASEAKAYSSLGMAQNFQVAGKSDKAAERYEQILKDYPDTLCAVVSRQKLEELKAVAEPK